MPKLTIEVIMNEIKHLQKDIKDGFSGVHTRQDIANGKLAKHEGLIIELEKADIEMGKRFTQRYRRPTLTKRDRRYL